MKNSYKEIIQNKEIPILFIIIVKEVIQSLEKREIKEEKFINKTNTNKKKLPKKRLYS